MTSPSHNPSHENKPSTQNLATKTESWLKSVVAGFALSGFGGLTLPELKTQEPVPAVASAQGRDNIGLLLRLGKEMRNVEMVDTKGARFNLTDLRGKDATLVVFLNFQCPVSNRYVPVLNQLADTFGKQGVSMIGVVCDVENQAELDKHVGEFRVGFKMMYDPLHKVSRHFLADTTPQAFVLDKDLTLRYFGAIDDQYLDRTTRLSSAAKSYVADAIKSSIAGKKPEVDHTQAIGCALTTEKPEPKASGSVTYHRDIEPILQQHCQRCHHPNDVAPFSLLKYEDALSWADDIKDYTERRLMPPWPITGGVKLKNDISLSQREIDLIKKWVEEGCPKGDAKDAPKPLQFKPQDAWDDMRAPDVVLKLPTPMHIGPKGEDHYRTVVFPLNNKEELYVRKMQFIPGNKKIVHHSLMFYDGTGMVLDAQNRLGNAGPRKPGDADFGPGYESGMGLGFIPNPANLKRNKDNPGAGLGGWVPGTGALEHPEGVRTVIPPGADILIQLHYTRTGKPEIDSESRLALWFDKETPKKYSQGLVLDTTFRMIPKGVSRFKSTGTKIIPEDSELWVLSPHMHLLGKECRIWHQAKGSADRTLLLELKGWDFNWQSRYLLEKPFPMKKGDALHIEAIYDNSAGNPNNPHKPPKMVFLGESTEDEMGFSVVGLIRTTRPGGGADFVNYFERLLEAEGLKKLLGGK